MATTINILRTVVFICMMSSDVLSSRCGLNLSRCKAAIQAALPRGADSAERLAELWSRAPEAHRDPQPSPSRYEYSHRDGTARSHACFHCGNIRRADQTTCCY